MDRLKSLWQDYQKPLLALIGTALLAASGYSGYCIGSPATCPPGCSCCSGKCTCKPGQCKCCSGCPQSPQGKVNDDQAQ